MIFPEIGMPVVLKVDNPSFPPEGVKNVGILLHSNDFHSQGVQISEAVAYCKGLKGDYTAFTLP